MVKPSGSRELAIPIRSDSEAARAVLKALASEPRLRILELLGENVYNVSQIAEKLDMPLSTANLHINILEEAELLLTEYKPASRGSQKLCTRAHESVRIQFPPATHHERQVLEMSMPIGAYVDARVAPTCGLASEASIIGLLDDPSSFFEPDRVRAQLVWFHHGHVEYRFPNRLPSKTTLDSLQLSVEVCSEAPLHHSDWPSDVTTWVNGVEIGSWTSPADFGDQRGKLTPSWWQDQNSQYGLLKVWQANRSGSYVDGLPISDVRVADLGIEKEPYISVRIGVREDARHVGGLNIFGRMFGNYPQDVVLRLRYV